MGLIQAHLPECMIGIAVKDCDLVGLLQHLHSKRFKNEWNP
jgi:hypothetical protein